MSEAVLAVNAGSSSIKFALFEIAADGRELDLDMAGEVEGIGDAPRLAIVDAAGGEMAREGFPATLTHEDLLMRLLRRIEGRLDGGTLRAVGHRVVHGGTDFAAPVRIDDGVLARLDALVPLAPLHQPHNLAAIRALARLAPEAPQIACFDTGFHRSQPALATAFALPRTLTESGVRRYGFHGLSYEYIAHVLPDHAGAAADGRVVVAHLGHGASMCAMRGRRSVATTMGFTALDGLPMGHRCGALDPGVLLYLMRSKGMDYDALSDLLYHRSGLLGVSGISDDMRDLLASGEPAAREAVDLFVYRIIREMGSLAAALGGLDALVFTAGIGEHAAAVREGVCRGAEWLGVALDARANAEDRTTISRPDSRVAVFVIPTDEDLMIARHALAVATGRGQGENARASAATAIRTR